MKHAINVVPKGQIIQKHKKEKNIILEIISDYCSSSSLHGIRYLGANDKNLAEKIWWFIMFLLSVVACSYLISETWIKWQTNPVILSFEKEQIPVWQIPFPAITVCPVNKVQQTEYNYTEMFRNRYKLTGDEYKEFWDISLVCDLEQIRQLPKCSINITDESAITLIREIAPSLDHTIGGASWQNREQINMFAEQLTQEGLCFTFNSFSQEDMFTDELNPNVDYIKHKVQHGGWSMEDGYLPGLSRNTYPRRTAKDGQDSGISFVLLSFTDEIDYVCGASTSGYKVILHNPVETPKVAQHYILVPLNRKVTIIVRPELTTTSRTLLTLSAHTRKCFFSTEKFLRFYKVYTQNNCRMECEANVTLQYCGCVAFHMPRDANTSICGYGRKECLKEVETVILHFEAIDKESEMPIEDRNRLESTRDTFSKCDCLPACSNLQYTTETSQTDIHYFKNIFASGITDGQMDPKLRDFYSAGKLTVTLVDIFFKESQFLALHRSELYGQTDFLAKCGGLLGLFMGFSLLSLLEIVYFLTIRLWFKFRQRRQNRM